MQDIIAIMGMDELSDEDKLLCKPCKKDPEIPVSAVQHVAEQFTGMPGNLCATLKETIRGFKEIH